MKSKTRRNWMFFMGVFPHEKNNLLCDFLRLVLGMDVGGLPSAGIFPFSKYAHA